jgi:hypothetical protein
VASQPFAQRRREPEVAGGAQARVEAELAAQAKQALLRPGPGALPPRSAHRTEKDSVTLPAEEHRLGGKRVARRLDGGPAHEGLFRVEGKTGLEYPERGPGDLGADPVTGKDRNPRRHDTLQGTGPAARSKAAISFSRSRRKASSSRPLRRQ